MDGAGPTDPMALLMRQRIVFLGTQARRPPRPPASRGVRVTAAFPARAVQRPRRNGALFRATLKPWATRHALTLLSALYRLISG
jgi:hypothetical protein